ncbi:hypothetical protein [Arenibacter palladensis]|uniref:hypothetical protein n=1 Tax=Arenibacter palladensis TaxID=237373 RepID=UPI0026E27569|nr:hypothetical protein [Arenibacter palladensis]MDO6604868.1 hypothetical protein [Arenibacter palladensis]
MMALWFVISLTSCGTSRIIVKKNSNTLTDRLPQPNSIFIITKEDPNLGDSFLIGTIATKHNGFSGDCNLRQVKRAAEKEAKEIGGNLIFITKHKLPNALLNPCHRIRGNIYSVPNPEAFEKEILWNPNRKLQVKDFKGSPLDKPYVAATNTYFGYSTSVKSEENLVIVEVDTYFDCELSYFKNNKNQSLVLNHEQLHFDITELYARKFIQRLHQEIKSFEDLITNVERIGNEVNKELLLKQEDYDKAVYSDLSQQSYWDEWTETGLRELDTYNSKTISRPYRKD